MKLLLHSIVITFYFFVPAQSQTTTLPSSKPQSTPPPQTRSDVVRITTNLVQVDVTVVDHNGQPVNNLSADDFEVIEDGRPQKITNLSFIAPEKTQPRPATAAPPAKAAKGVAPEPPPPPVTLRRDQVRRAMALVVDDLGLSFESSHLVRQALKKFVDEQMQPGDLVAIIRTGAGMGALQQFTADKRLLYAAIERVRYNLNSRGFNAFAPIGGETRIADKPINGMAGPTRDSPGNTNASPGSEFIDSLLRLKTPGIDATKYRDDIFSVGTLGAINFILRGLRELPGRKSIILFSDGFRVYDEDEGSRRIVDSLNRLVDLANRASVVIHTVDARGLQPLGLTAADNLAGPLAPGNTNFGAGNGDPTQGQWVQGITGDLRNRRTDFLANQQGLGYLAQQTGGTFMRNTDIEEAVGRLLKNQKGYYLLGYRPDESTFNQEGKRAGFHRIDVKVKRADLTVRTRAGFYGFTDEEAARPVYRNASEHLYAALASPFASGDIRVRMSSVFGYDPERSSFTESILHIDARDLTFNKQGDGTYKASFQIVTATFGDNGGLVDQAERGYSIAVQEANLERTYKSGVIYLVTLPIKKAGAYQLRMAVRDSTSARVGSANQFIEIPDIKKKRLTLSGIILGASSPPPAAAANMAGQPGAAASSAAAAVGPTTGSDNHALAAQAIRRFSQRQKLTYGYYIYNARLDSARRPRLETQVRLFRDGKLVYTGQAKPLDAAGQTDMRQIVAGGEILLGTDLSPGEYVLQVIVVDKLAGGENLTTQWMDFDLLE